jgi:hypothetical protein
MGRSTNNDADGSNVGEEFQSLRSLNAAGSLIRRTDCPGVGLMDATFCALRGCGCRIGRGCAPAAGANDNDFNEFACLLAELAPVFLA